MALGDTLILIFRRAWGDSLGALVSSPAHEGSARVDGEGAARTGSATSGPPELALPSSLAEARDEAEAITDELVRWLWSRNQFEPLDEQAREQLFASVEGALATMERSGQLEPALSEHRAELSAFVRARYGQSPREVVCSEYAPDLQLAVLGLGTASLSQPVLDIGCGPHATLVGALSREGIDARGIDRVVDRDSELASQADWLSYAYGRARYGTVLSHLGFSLHFLHHHMAAGETAYDYARAYMAILGSLTVGGRFVYTPGLPFLETLLDPAMYRVHHVAFADELRVASLRQIESTTGLALSHATHVIRLR
jgi:hypothetical protein